MTSLSSAVIPVITIDGPSASGKGTVAQRVAQALGFYYLDSGALYRIVAFAAVQRDISWYDAERLAAMVAELTIRFSDEKVWLNAQDISEFIRTEEISQGASQVAVHPPVRQALVALQRSFKLAPGLVADGRDMGSVIFTEASTKIFLTATAETRAERRYNQLKQKGKPAKLDDILQDLRERDQRDMQRTSAPLKQEADAMLLQTDNLSIEQAVDSVLQHYRNTQPLANL